MTESRKRNPWAWLLAVAIVVTAAWAALNWTDLTAGFREGYEAQTRP